MKNDSADNYRFFGELRNGSDNELDPSLLLNKKIPVVSAESVESAKSFSPFVIDVFRARQLVRSPQLVRVPPLVRRP
jgi:hypothetical protein